jgi:hypothetical protein
LAAGQELLCACVVSYQSFGEKAWSRCGRQRYFLCSCKRS